MVASFARAAPEDGDMSASPPGATGDVGFVVEETGGVAVVGGGKDGAPFPRRALPWIHLISIS
jgi:hypothetical protein